METTGTQQTNRAAQTYCLDGDFAEILLGDVHVLDLRRETFLDEELQQGRVVGRGPLRRRRRGPVRLGQQGLDSAVGLRGEEDLGHGRLEVLLFILVLVKRLPQLHWNIFWREGKTTE